MCTANSVLVHLIDEPAVSIDSVRRTLPEASRRLVALLALDRRPLDRRFVAGTLWPDIDDNHAAGSLRTSLWRLRRAGLDIIAVTKTSLRLRAGADVDVSDELDWAARVIARRTEPEDLVMTERRRAALDLLPGDYDHWVEPHRERLRQRMLHAFDELSVAFSVLGRHADAIDVAQVSVFAEPLRESGQRALIRAHLAEGNMAEARRVFARFAWLLDNEMGFAPSEELARSVGLTHGMPGGPAKPTV